MPLNSQVLAQFLTVYNNHSLGKACRELGVSQPALSRAIRRLEDELGVVLFERRSTGMEPTRYADALATRAKVIQAEIRKAAGEIQDLKSNLIGEARLGLGPGLAAGPLPEIIARLRDSHPGLSVLVFEGLYDVLIERLLAGEIDVAVTTTPVLGPSEELESELLGHDEFIVAAGATHELSRRHRPLAPVDLLAASWVLPPRDGELWQRVTEWFRREGMLPPKPVVETNSGVCIKGLLLTGRFVSFVPKELIAHELASREMVVLPITKFGIEREMVFLKRRGAVVTPATNMIVELFKREASRSGDSAGFDRATN